MRVIKFRRWDSKAKVMDYNVIFNPTHDNTHLMQYINLSDRHGKEIYEGDCVKLTDGSIGVIKYNEDFLAYVAEEVGFKSHDFNDPVNKDITAVIGNIYDNPELVK